MQRLALALAAACLSAVLVPGLASATEIQVGASTTALAPPTCTQEATVQETEGDCEIALDTTTAYETVSDGTANPDLITTPGVIDAFTLGISGLYIQGAPLSSLLSSADSSYGGAPSAQLTLLRPAANRSGPRWVVAAQSPVMPLVAYITGAATGSITEFPLIAPIPVVRGEMVAITIPTWAPILTIGLPANQFSYIQSHSPQVSTAQGASPAASCQNDVAPTRAQLTLGQQAQYLCSYQGTRLEYSALELTAPSVNASARRHHKLETHRHTAKHGKAAKHGAPRRRS